MTQVDGDVCWRRPNEHTTKVNVEAALFKKSNSYNFSMIARNHNCDLVEAASSCKHDNIAPEMVEAIAIKNVLNCIKSHC